MNKFEPESPKDLQEYRENIVFRKLEYTIIKRYYYDPDEPTLEALAEELNISVTTLKVQKNSALEKIRKYEKRKGT